MGIAEVHAVEALLSTAHTVAVVHLREHVEREHHVLQYVERVEERCALEYHAHLAAHLHFLFLRHRHEVATVVEHLATRRREQTHEVFHQYGLSRTALSDDEVRLAVLEDGVDVFQHFLVAE